MENSIFDKEAVEKTLRQTKNVDDKINIIKNLANCAMTNSACKDFLKELMRNRMKLTKEMDESCLSMVAAKVLYDISTTAKEQITILRFEGLYAIKDKAAQQFIVHAAQGKGNVDDSVKRVATDEFYKFFVNYVRYECFQSLCSKNTIQCGYSSNDDLIEEATNHCFLFILPVLEKYDPNKAALTSFFIPYIRDALDDFRSQSLGYSSKTILQINRKVKRELNKIQTEQRTPDITQIARNTGFTVDQVQLAMNRINAANNSVSYDSDELKERVSGYDTPELSCIKKENTKEICDALSQLSDMEQAAVSNLMGFQQINDELIDVPAKTIAETSDLLDISEKEVNRFRASATKKLRVILGSKEQNQEIHGRVLNKHEVLFTDSPEDTVVKNVIDTIVEIIE